MHMSEEFVIFSVLSHHNKILKGQTDGPVLQLRVTVQFHLESKGKYILKVWRPANPKEEKRREARTTSQFGSSFYMFFLLPLSLP